MNMNSIADHHHSDAHVDEVSMDAAHRPDEATIGRRDFLTVAGCTVAALTAGCERPGPHPALPHTSLDPEATPGAALWYAGTCASCSAGCGVLARCRDNRPVKLEGIPGHPVSDGGLCAAGQASLLELYDEQRLKTPSRNGSAISWEILDTEVMKELAGAREKGGRVRVLTSTITSPTLKNEIDAFLGGFADGGHVQYDVHSVSALLDAHEEAFGRRALPRFRFDKARSIVSFDADFLGTWISPVEYATAWKKGRNPEDAAQGMSFHLHIEARMSLTGSKADERVALNSIGKYALLRLLAHRIEVLSGATVTPAPAVKSPLPALWLDNLAARLWKDRGQSLIVSGSNDIGIQRLMVRINTMLGNYGSTIDIANPSRQKAGNDRELHALHQELLRGEVDALIMLGVNPVYDAPDAWKFADAMKRASLTICITTHAHETAKLSRYVCPTPHPLEDWFDAEPISGMLCLSQPVIPPINTLRSALESFSAWRAVKTTSLASLRTYWRDEVFPRCGATDFDVFWNESLRNGSAIARSSQAPVAAPKSAIFEEDHSDPIYLDGDLELLLHAAVALHGGTQPCNAWLLELPDPITKVSWENVAALGRQTAAALKIENGDLIKIVPLSGQPAIELPALIQEGQAEGCIAIALGYGSVLSERFVKTGPDWLFAAPSVGQDGRVGVRAAGLLHFSGTTLRSEGSGVSVTRTGRNVRLAFAQEYHYLAEPGSGGDGTGVQRSCVQETSLAALLSGKTHAPSHDEHQSMWPEHPYENHHWGMSIDLAACTGCSACVVACQIENNIPVVGKDEVRRNRELHWLRIDRYYFKDGRDLRVAHQPMLCHHCDNAPCETVCPVLATVHSEEGLNQQVYNRCVGTRYCANNCPYKVRRFNWFDYAHEDETRNLVLNPDVTVRSRGVMEKCSFCVQRIQEAKIQAKIHDRPLVDGEIQPACMQSCPTNAIVFGDMNDRASALVGETAKARHYRALEEVGVKPSVGYLMQVRNAPTTDKEDRNV